MFGCYRDGTMPVSKKMCLDESLTEIQVIMNDLRTRRRNQRLLFLILLREEDYRKCLFSYKDVITYRKHNFPGDLIVEKYEDCHQLPYSIQDPPIPRQLYIMLPKEKIFVASEIFTESYIRSKMRELLQIFVKLNAKSVKFMQYDSQKESSNIGLDACVSVPQAQISQGTRVEKEDSQFSGFQYEMKFNENTSEFDPKIFSSDEYYYLQQESNWQDMIRRRLDYNMTYDKYTYKNTERKLLKSKFVNKMKVIDLSADYDWEKYKQFVIDYEIEYYPDMDHSNKIPNTA